MTAITTTISTMVKPAAEQRSDCLRTNVTEWHIPTEISLLSAYCTCFSPRVDRNSFQLPYYFKTNGKSICYLECFMMIVLCGLQGNQPDPMFIENI